MILKMYKNKRKFLYLVEKVDRCKDVSFGADEEDYTDAFLIDPCHCMSAGEIEDIERDVFFIESSSLSDANGTLR